MKKLAQHNTMSNEQEHDVEHSGYKTKRLLLKEKNNVTLINNKICFTIITFDSPKWETKYFK